MVTVVDTDTRIIEIAESSAREIRGILTKAETPLASINLQARHDTNLVKEALRIAEEQNNRAIVAGVLSEVMELIGTQVARRFNIPKLEDFEDPENFYESKDLGHPEAGIRYAIANTLFSAFKLLNNQLKYVDDSYIPRDEDIKKGDRVTVVIDPLNYEYGALVEGFTRGKDSRVKLFTRSCKNIEVGRDQIAREDTVKKFEYRRRQEYVNCTYSLIGAIVKELNLAGLL